ncbi:hypothetical protein DFJ74DRAFT_677894 [Hyaloraphidium curvatum]|nr:hypothetical protein DFJ74DRAFT_677894 [Hyaloraphidium curvatum]
MFRPRPAAAGLHRLFPVLLFLALLAALNRSHAATPTHLQVGADNACHFFTSPEDKVACAAGTLTRRQAAPSPTCSPKPTTTDAPWVGTCELPNAGCNVSAPCSTCVTCKKSQCVFCLLPEQQATDPDCKGTCMPSNAAPGCAYGFVYLESDCALWGATSK